MNVVQRNWKGVVVGVAVMAAGVYGGPIAGKVTGYILPKALDQVSDTPITDIVHHTNPLTPPSHAAQAPRVSTPLRATLYRATLAQVARDFGILGRLDCRVIQP